MAEHMHGGHRQRVKDRYITAGIEAFSPHEMIEMLLFFAIPQKDTNALAHRLLETFGSVRGVLNAERNTLLEVEGMTANAATLLTFLGDVRKYCNCENDSRRISLLDTDEQVDFFRPRFEDRTREEVWIACLDVAGRLLGVHKISDGTPLEAEINFRQVMLYALADNAVHILLAHNHPSGLAIPSTADIRCTAKLATALKTIGITMTDHLIFARGDCVSFRQTRSIQSVLEGVIRKD